MTAHPATPTPTPTPVKPEDACGGDPFNARKVRPYNPEGPAYAGKGVHPAELVPLYFTEDPYETKLPRAWDARLGSAPDQVQLLVCAYRDESYRSKRVGTCEYTDTNDSRSTARSMSARYRYRVFEAKTARAIVTFTLLGSVDSCPGSFVGGTQDQYYQYVLDSDLAAKLRPFIAGSAR